MNPGDANLASRADSACRFCNRSVALHWVPGGHFGICDQCLDDVERTPPQPLRSAPVDLRSAAN